MSINLPASLQSILTVGGINVETDAFAAVTAITVDYTSKVLSFVVKQGTTSGQSFSAGQYPPSYQFNLNLITGVWTINGSTLTGTISGAALTNVQNIFLNLRNTAEVFTVNQNLFPGSTQTGWTQV